MKSTMGHARRVTDAQVEIILAWQRNRRTFNDWARIFGVSRSTIINTLKACSSGDGVIGAEQSRVGPGRKRLLTMLQIETLLNWHRTRRTRAQLARELGLVEQQVGKVILRKGQYKRCCPEQHEAISAARRQKLARLDVPAWPTVERGVPSAFARMRAENAARARMALVVDNS